MLSSRPCRGCGAEINLDIPSPDDHDEADCLASKLHSLKALVGTIRDLTGCEVRNVDDVTPEQHSREIMARFEQFEIDADAVARADFAEKSANDLSSRLDSATEQIAWQEARFQAARDAWDGAFAGDEDQKFAMLNALAGVTFVKPTAEDLEACRRDLIQAGIVERQASKLFCCEKCGEPMICGPTKWELACQCKVEKLETK